MEDKKNITYGIVLCYIPNDDLNKIEYMYCYRKDSIWYSEFLRGNLPEEKLTYYLSFITKEEKKKLIGFCENKYSFDEIWNDMTTLKKETKHKKKRKDFFETNKIQVSELLRNIYPTQEYYIEFPKGRKEKDETPLYTALREFYEETKINISFVNILNASPIVYEHVGTDGNIYTVHYFIGICNKKIYPHCETMNNPFREFTISNEVSKIEWGTFDECTEKLLSHQKEILVKVKKKIKLFKPNFDSHKNTKIYKRKPFIKNLAK